LFTQADFIVDDKYLFEIGGKGKSRAQIAGHENAYIVADEMEFGYQNKIPIWFLAYYINECVIYAQNPFHTTDPVC